MKSIICIVCPKGCHLQVDEENHYAVTGNGCQRGIAYAEKELQNPTRMVTSTVRLSGAELTRLPVKTDGDIPKASIMAVMHQLNGLTVKAPVRMGDVIIPHVAGTDANIVATRSMKQV